MKDIKTRTKVDKEIIDGAIENILKDGGVPTAKEVARITGYTYHQVYAILKKTRRSGINVPSEKVEAIMDQSTEQDSRNRMNPQQLRTLVEDAFNSVNKKTMLSNELKRLVNYSGNPRGYGGYLNRLIIEGIIRRDSEKLERVGLNKFYYYRLVEQPISIELKTSL